MQARRDLVPGKLPEWLREFFWEYRFGSLRWERDRDLITSRLLAYGSWKAIHWLREQAGDAELRAWIVQREGRGLSPRQLRYWELILELPPRQVNAWVAEARQSVWGRRTAR